MRLINADKIKYTEYINGDVTVSKNKIEMMPTIDAVPVTHGRWGNNGIDGSILCGCSVCGYTCGAYSFNYCPSCGAKMDLDD